MTEQFQRKFPSGFYWRVLLFKHILKSIPKYPFWGSTERVISNGSIHITKQSVGKLHFSIYQKMFPISPQASMCLPISPLRIRLWQVSIHLWYRISTMTSGMHMSQRCFSEIFSPVSTWRYFRFHHKPQDTPEYPLSDSPRTLLEYCSMKTEA